MLKPRKKNINTKLDMARFILFINSVHKYLLNTSSVPGTVLGARNPAGNMRNGVSTLKTLMWKMGQIQENKRARAGTEGDGGRRPRRWEEGELKECKGDHSPAKS